MAAAVIGGVMLGAASGLVFVLLGRVSGVTGMIAGAWPAARNGWQWPAAFLAGLVVAGAIGRALSPASVPGLAAPLGLAIASGALVGFGARYGGGCTSGHGVCGVGRLSRRSIVGTATFVTAAMIVVYVVRHTGTLS